jgi:hypothetical protein
MMIARFDHHDDRSPMIAVFAIAAVPAHQRASHDVGDAGA